MSLDSSFVKKWNDNPEAMQCFKAFKDGSSVAILGGPGRGKTELTNSLIEYARGTGKKVLACAYSQNAARNVKGVTSHRLLGLVPDHPKFIGKSIGRIIHLLGGRTPRSNVVIVIDEISMLPCDFFEYLDEVLQALFKTSRVMGGVQLLVIGDFNQLPPIELSSKHKATFCILDQSFAKQGKYVINHTWASVFGTGKSFMASGCVRVMKKNYRQANDPIYSKIITCLENGTLLEHPDLIDILKNCTGAPENSVRLYFHKASCERYNRDELAKLEASPMYIDAIDSVVNPGKHDIAIVDRNLDERYVPKTLLLAVGARVIITRNTQGYTEDEILFNGAQGTIRDINLALGTISVDFDDFEGTRTISRATYNVYDESTITKEEPVIIGSRNQFPLALAYGLTIHKSQGATLTSVYVDLTGVPSFNALFVALTRCTTLAKMTIVGFDESMCMLPPWTKYINDYLERCSKLEAASEFEY